MSTILGKGGGGLLKVLREGSLNHEYMSSPISTNLATRVLLQERPFSSSSAIRARASPSPPPNAAQIHGARTW